MWRTKLTRKAGASGTKRLLREYGERLVCVRYRYDEERGERLKTVEIVVDAVPLEKRRSAAEVAAELVQVRLRRGEDLLRRALLFAGAKYDEKVDAWHLTRASAASLGVLDRAKRIKRR